MAIQEEPIDDEERVFSLQAQDFLTHFNNIQYLLQQIAHDSQASLASHSSGGISSGEPLYQMSTPVSVQPVYTSPQASLTHSMISSNQVNYTQQQMMESLKQLFDMNMEMQKQLNQ